jgi:hypothetical protein
MTIECGDISQWLLTGMSSLYKAITRMAILKEKGLTNIKAAALPLCCQQKSFHVGWFPVATWQSRKILLQPARPAVDQLRDADMHNALLSA